MKLDILGQKMIAFDRSRSRGAYVRGTLHNSYKKRSRFMPIGVLYGQKNETPHLMRISIIYVRSINI
jgi:hypothetical protein